MRGTTVLRRILAIPEVRVVGAELGAEGLIVDVRLRRAARLRCPSCAFTTRAVYDRRPERRWRHLDFGAWRCWLRMALRRLACPDHGVVTEAVPFAPAHSGYSTAFEDAVAWHAQHADQTTITHLLRISWRSVGRIIERWTARHRSADALSGIVRAGIDDKAWRRGHRYVSLVADHDAGGRVVWMAEGRAEETLAGFFKELGPERSAALEAVSLDMSTAYLNAITAAAPQATVCFDPFHVVKLANAALDEVRRQEWNKARAAKKGARQLKHTRWALLKRPERLSAEQKETLSLVRRHNDRLWRGYEIKELVRAVYGEGTVAEATNWLDDAIRRARRSRLDPFKKLGATLRQYKEGILAAVRLGLSNSKLEGLNSRLALVNHRASGFHSVKAFIAMALLCVGGFHPVLPHQ